MASIQQELMDLPTDLLFERLAKYGVRIDEKTFVKMANKHGSPAGVVRRWKVNQLADASVLTSIASILWSRLCPDLSRVDEIEDAMRQGYRLMEKRNEDHRRYFDKKRKHPNKVSVEDDATAKERYDQRTVEVVTFWLKAWDKLRGQAQARSIRSAERLPDLITVEEDLETPINWLQDLEMELENLSWAEQPGKPARSDKVFPEAHHWAEERLHYVREVMETLPDSDPLMIFNMRRDEAEAYFLLDDAASGDKLYAQLVEDEPTHAWAYIGWGDMYSPQFCALSGGPDVARAREIYERGLGPVKEERDEIEERIALLDRE